MLQHPNRQTKEHTGWELVAFEPTVSRPYGRREERLSVHGDGERRQAGVCVPALHRKEIRYCQKLALAKYSRAAKCRIYQYSKRREHKTAQFIQLFV